MAQRLDGPFIHDDECGHEDAEGDDGEEQEALHGADDEEVGPELHHPVRLEAGAAVGVAVGEQVPVYGELEPDETARQAGRDGEQGRLAPYLQEDVAALGPETAHDADVLGALAYLQPEGAQRAQHDDDGEEHQGDGGQRGVHRVVVGHLIVVVLPIGLKTGQHADAGAEVFGQCGREPRHEDLGIGVGLQPHQQFAVRVGTVVGVGKEDDVGVALVGGTLHVLHHAGYGVVARHFICKFAVGIVGGHHGHALAHHLVVAEEYPRHAAGDDDAVGGYLARECLGVGAALDGAEALRLEEPLVLVVQEVRVADGVRGVVGQGQRAPVVVIEVGPKVVGRKADRRHLGQAGQFFAYDVDTLGFLVGDNLLRGTLATDDTHLPHAQMVFLELAGRCAEVGGVERDDEEVDDEPAQAGDEGYLDEYPAVLLLVSPQTLQYHAHLF